MAMKPIVLAMLICDYYYRDVHTGKSILTGTFSSINSGGFPTKHGNCAIYIALTDVAADSQAQLVFREVADIEFVKDGDGFPILNQPPWEMSIPPWEVKCSDNRRAVVEIGGNISGLPLPRAGEYEFVLKWNGMEIASRRLVAVKVDMQGGGGGAADPPDPLEDYNQL